MLLLAVAVALLAVACDSRPEAPEFQDSTTTSTTLAGSEAATTTTPTLPPPEERIVGTVTSITDGDTADIAIDGVSTTVRLLGINAPEMDECWGPESAATLSGMILGQQVLLVAGEEDLDQFGRSLRFLYLEDADTVRFINAEMVSSGSAVGVQNGNELAADMKASEASAFQSGKGMWATFACGDSEGVSADRPVVRVSEVVFDPEGPDEDVLSGEYVTIVNEGYGRVSVSGWTVRDESSSNRFTIPSGTVLAPGDTLTIITGCDGGPEGAVHWCSDQPVWSNSGDTVIVTDTLGNAVMWHTYSGDDA